ncbi:hypothetical protein [Neomegalonema perideroedes]|uniref:hypothetical protein n=1 Tax=Neomegalonema perideroedes TaxID=217219 RepID=UPI00036937DD|nr:hypothetical protein [Neomegalonema perideroedes]
MAPPFPFARLSRWSGWLFLAILSAGCAHGGASGVLGSGAARAKAPPEALRGEALLTETIRTPAARQSFLNPIRRLDVVAETPAGIEAAVSHAATLARSDAAYRPTRLEAAQIGLLYGDPQGRAFVETLGPRALAQGEPADQCPALALGRGPDDPSAARTALQGCFAALQGREDCGCRLLAENDRLLATASHFSYALGVSATLVDPAARQEMTLVAEERAVANRPDASVVWLLGFDGPKGALHLEPDGVAALAFLSEGPIRDPKWIGRHQAEGFRRGRVARRAFLRNAEGEERIVLVGFEAQELAERHAELVEPPPQLTAPVPPATPLLARSASPAELQAAR